MWSRPIRFFSWLALFSLIATFGSSVILDRVTRGSNWSDIAPLAVIFTFAILFIAAFVGLILSIIPATRPLMVWAIRRWFFCVAALITVIALFYAEEDFRGKWAWDNFKHEWEAKGEHFDWSAFVPPPVADDQNFAMTPLLRPILDFYPRTNGVHWRDTNAYAHLNEISIYASDHGNNQAPNWAGVEQGKLNDLGAWQKYYRTSTNFPQPKISGTAAEDILGALGKFDAEMNELREAAAARPASRFPIQYDEQPPFQILLPHLAQMRKLSQLFLLRSIALMELGRSNESLTDLQMGFRLSDSIRDEPLLIDHLVRIATLAITLQGVHEGLARPGWNDAQLVRLEKYLGSLDILAEANQNMRGERGFGLSGVDYFRRMGFRGNPAELMDDGASRSASLLGGYSIMPGGWYYQNMVSMAGLHQKFILAAIDEKQHRVFPEINQAFTEAVSQMRTTPYNIFSKLLLPALANSSRKSARVQTFVDEALVACALERHRLAKGQVPDSLDALVPQFIEKIPSDVIDGKPLRYRKNSDGSYILYSVGWNQTDDGGEIAWSKGKDPRVDISQGDWVWQLPAK